MVFIYLFISRDIAIHPQGICGLGNTKETSHRRVLLLLQRKSFALGSALCASLGVRAPLQKRYRKIGQKEKQFSPHP
jgi:hypothetical protein